MGPGRRMDGRVVQRIRPFLSTLALSALLAACGGGGDDGTPAPETPPVVTTTACADLAGLTFTAAQIGLPTQGASVSSATSVAATDAGNTLGDYCRVRGTIAPVDPQAPAITFAVNLPAQWNHKAIHFGGGGFDGVLIDGTEVIRFGPLGKPAPLALGYATYGDDSGHQSSSITDGRFAANDEQLANYGGQSLKKTRDVAQALVFVRYAMKPKHAYFLGTSTGGRDALSYIQRWPEDYDGVIANEPALNYTGTRLSNVAVGRALYKDGGKGWMTVGQTVLVQNAAKAACDKLDGAVDNIVSNVESCRKLNEQILAALPRCPGDISTGDTCLTEAQIKTVRAIEDPLEFSTYSLANGVKRAGGYNILEGTQVAGPYTTRDLGTSADKRDANVFVTGDQWAKYFVMRDANFDTLTLDPLNPGGNAARVTEVSNLTDATNPNLAPFFDHGGRIIMLHGLADEVISNNSTIDYYKQVVATLGQAAVDKGMRFYTVPGMGHGTGVFIPNWDSLAALEGWVEGGLAPATGVAVDAVPATYGRTRPLCLFPSWPKYKGSGSLDAAVNYSCVTEVGNPLACPNLPAAVTTYKGGDSFGEELSVKIDPAAMAYTVTIDESVQDGRKGVQRSGTLVSQERLCSYASDEAGAVFTFATGGVLAGGVSAPVGDDFAPLLAFQNTFENAAKPGTFNPVAFEGNVAGVQQDTASMVGKVTTAAQAFAVKLRNAGTFQYCRDPVVGFVPYLASCTSPEKGYITYNAARNAFDVHTTDASGSAVTEGGVITGSMVIGLVNGTPVPLHLVRESKTNAGLRVFTPQLPLSPGAADGSYTLSSVKGENHEATVAGSSFNLGGDAAILTYDTPVKGVVQSDAGRPGNFIFNGGVLVFLSTATAGTNAALEIGVRH